MRSEPVKCFPDPPGQLLIAALASLGISWQPAKTLREAMESSRLSIIDASSQAARSQGRDPRGLLIEAIGAMAVFEKHGVFLVLPREQLGLIPPENSGLADFCCDDAGETELALRLDLLLTRAMSQGQDQEGPEALAPGRPIAESTRREHILTRGPLSLNFETYRASIAGRVLDLTYMEYELLKFLASHPGKVCTRELLLNQVWGYDYYGGARTVDVHVRRLRAKLGEEHAHMIETVRSVGYRFAAPR
jgi:hypothetical protein